MLDTAHHRSIRRGSISSESMVLVLAFLAALGGGYFLMENNDFRAAMVRFFSDQGPENGSQDASPDPQLQELAAAAAKAARAPDEPERKKIVLAPEIRPVEITPPPAARSEGSHTRRAPPAEDGPRSLAYWNGLNQIMTKEVSMRATPSSQGLTASTAGGFIDRRGAAAAYAADAIRRLPKQNVDREVIALAEEIAVWYDETTQLTKQAGHLVREADEAGRRGAPGQSWKQGEDAHRRRVADINRRGAQLRGRLSQKYRLPFPPLE